ncbi:hypothetical protein ABPG75_009935 [Micractinium tetrahymenae]
MSGRSGRALLLFLALSWVALAVTGQNETFKGYATAYTWPGEKNSQFAGGFNACQFGRLSPYFETYFAALNTPQYEQGLCGRCAAVRGTGSRATGKIVVVKIVDECATCAYGDLDFTTRGSNDITGYSFDHQPIEWWWTSCDNPVPPRWPYFDVAGGMQIVSEARAKGYNVNLAMMMADLTLTGGVVPYPQAQAAVAQATASQAISQAQAARAAAYAATSRARQLQTAAAAAWAKVARLQQAAAAINGTAQPEAKKAAVEAANAAYTAAQAARDAATQAVTAAKDASARATAATARAQQARQQAAAAVADDRRRQQAAAAAAAQRAAEERRRAIAAMQAAAAAAAAARQKQGAP